MDGFKDTGRPGRENFDRVKRSDISQEERIKAYGALAEIYDEDVKPSGYSSPAVTAQSLADIFQSGRETMSVLDVAAGTGLCGEQLVKQGFKMIDGIDYSPDMLSVARRKNIYRNVVCDALSSKPTELPENAYDAVAVSGGFCNGHLPCDSVIEILRVTKPGGVICFVQRSNVFDVVQEYKDKFIPMCQELERERKWKKLKDERFPNFLTNIEGSKIIYEKC